MDKNEAGKEVSECREQGRANSREVVCNLTERREDFTEKVI